jgi:hypothetical protein
MVRVVAICLAGALVLAAGSASADEKSETRQRLESFQRVAFGWFLDGRCGFLPAVRAIEFEWNFETAYNALKDAEETVDIAEIIRESAEEAANSGRYACDAAMGDITDKAMTESRRLVAALSRPPFDAETSYPELLSAYLANAAAASAIEARCNLLAPERRTALFEGYKAAAAEVRARFGDAAVERAETAAKATAATIARAHCTPSMRPFLASLFTDLERLRRGLTRLQAASP